MNGHTPRPATSADNAGLLALAAACPMRGELTLCVRREPDFFALNRLQGDRWDVGVVDAGRAGVIGCIAIAERLAYVNGVPAPTAYVSDLKVHPAFRGRRNGTGRVADALPEYARETLGASGPHMPVLVTVLGGNAAMAPRLRGPRGRAAAPAGAGAWRGRLSPCVRRGAGARPLVLLDRTTRCRAPGRVRRAVGPAAAEAHGRAAVCPAGRAVPLRVQPGRTARRVATAPRARHTASLLERVSGLRPGDRSRCAARAPGQSGAGSRGLPVRLLLHRARRHRSADQRPRRLLGPNDSGARSCRHARGRL